MYKLAPSSTKKLLDRLAHQFKARSMHHNNRTGSIAYNDYDKLLGHILWLQNNLPDSVAPIGRITQCTLDLVRVLDQAESGWEISSLVLSWEVCGEGEGVVVGELDACFGEDERVSGECGGWS